MCNYLSRHHGNVYRDVGKQNNLVISEPMDAVGLAALQQDNNLKDYQVLGVLKHFRYATGSKVAAPFRDSKKLCLGHIKPITGKLNYQFDGKGVPETISWSYQPVDELFTTGLSSLLGHLCEDHAINQFLSLPPGLFRLLIEEWVEHNHQIGSRVETRYRNQQDFDLRANSIVQSIHQLQHPKVQQRIKDVNKPRVGGAYRKREVPPASQDSPERQQQDLHSRTSSRTQCTNILSVM